MAWKALDPESWQTAPIATFGEGLLLTASCGAAHNTMTVAWGALGVFWGKPVVLFGIRPSRFTFRLAEEGEAVSLAILPRVHRAALTYCGTHSGGGGEKVAAAGLTAVTMPDGGYGFLEADTVISARTVYSTPLQKAGFRTPCELQRWYKDGDLHVLYAAEILNIYVKI